MFTTSTPLTRTPAAHVVGAFRAMAKVVAAVNRYWTAYTHRREARELYGWNDAMLRDIGITRGDLDSAFSSPYPVDPTLRLKVMAVERRAAARARARDNLVGIETARQAWRGGRAGDLTLTD